MVARTAYVQLRFSPLILAGTIVGLALVWLDAAASGRVRLGVRALGRAGRLGRVGRELRADAAAVRPIAGLGHRFAADRAVLHGSDRSPPRSIITAAGAWFGNAAPMARWAHERVGRNTVRQGQG